MTLHPIVVLVDPDTLATIDRRAAEWHTANDAVDMILDAHPSWDARALWAGTVLRQAVQP